MTTILRGLGIAPWIVGLARGVLEAAIIAGFEQLLLALDAVNIPGELQWIIPVAVLVIRKLEGLADQIDPVKRSSRIS